MRKELDEELVKNHPLLYSARHSDCKTTCMCWGFDVGEGWYTLIANLSDKLEVLIQQYLDQSDDTSCYNCGCDVMQHVIDTDSGHTGCSVIHHLPYHVGSRWGMGCPIPQWRQDFFNSFKSKVKFDIFWKYTVYKWLKIKTKNYFYGQINKILYKLYKKFNIGYDTQCHCSGYQRRYPHASQVKEKYGTLCFYMTSGTDEMYNLIYEAEAMSAYICETCGKAGKVRNGGWVVTLCDECYDKK